MLNLGNGSVTINTRKYAINWTGQHALHVAQNYIIEKPCHTILHVEIQQALAKSKHVEKDGANTYTALTEV